jgi:uncharacterized protein with von Willebrand factor type A (vWA) domain
MTNNSYFLDNLILFIHLLRQAGLPVSSEQSMDFARALTLVDIGSREQVYHTARSLLISRYEHLRLFDVLFNRFWRKQIDASANGHAQPAPLAPRHKRPEHRPLLMTYMARKAQENEPEIEVADKAGTFSNIEILQRKDFSTMTDEELESVKRLMQSLRWQVSLRQTRRFVADNKGQRLHLRRVLANAVKHGGVPLKLAWQSRKIKQRPLVLIADISGSMEKYARLVLQFFYCMAHSLKNVECFVFGTRLTRITHALKLKNIDRAIDEAAREVVDWSGGTRIGESLQQFNRQWSRRVLRRGAITLIVSDGWERGDVQELKQAMRYLQLRCHRLIWLNPLSGKSTYQPLVEGMQTALQHVDDFLPIHNLQSLSGLVDHLQQIAP